MAIRPTTTSFAILGLIAEHECSPYELAKQMELNLAYFWPSARSHVFTEVKKLERLRYVVGIKERTGSRRRTRYRITALGRQAMRDWLAEPPKTFAMEMEGLLRVFLATHGSRADLLGALESMKAEAEKMLRLAGSIVPAYLAGGGPYPQHIHVRAIMIDLLTHFAAAVHAWAARNIDAVKRWDDLEARGKERWARQALRTMPQWPTLTPARERIRGGRSADGRKERAKPRSTQRAR